MTEQQVRALLEQALRLYGSVHHQDVRDRSEQSDALLDLAVTPPRDGCAALAVRWWGDGRQVDVVLGEASVFEVPDGPGQEREVRALVVAGLLGDLAESVQYDAEGRVIKVKSTVWTSTGPRLHRARSAGREASPTWTQFRYEPCRVDQHRPRAADVFRLRLQIGRLLTGRALRGAVVLRELVIALLDGGQGTGLGAPAWVEVDDLSGRVVLRVPAGREPDAGQERLDELRAAAARLRPADFLHRHRKR